MTKISDKKFAITFPYDIDFVHLCFLVNYVAYPMDFDKGFKATGWASTKNDYGDGNNNNNSTITNYYAADCCEDENNEGKEDYKSKYYKLLENQNELLKEQNSNLIKEIQNIKENSSRVPKSYPVHDTTNRVAEPGTEDK